MEFTAKLVVSKTNPKARIIVVGAFFLVMSIFVSIKPKYERYAYVGFGVSFILVLLGAVLTKGKISESEVSTTDLVVGAWDITVGDSTYRLDLVKDLEFSVGASAGGGLEGHAGGVDRREVHAGGVNASATNAGGRNNYLKFSYCGEELKYRFLIGDVRAVRQLASLYREWYSKKVPFVEKTNGARTFMLEPVKGEKELAARKKAAGYV